MCEKRRIVTNSPFAQTKSTRLIRQVHEKRIVLQTNVDTFYVFMSRTWVVWPYVV